VTATGIGNLGSGFSAISRGRLEPASEGRIADPRKADAPGAVTRHPKSSTPANHPVSGFPLSAVSLPWVGRGSPSPPIIQSKGRTVRRTVPTQVRLSGLYLGFLVNMSTCQQAN